MLGGIGSVDDHERAIGAPAVQMRVCGPADGFHARSCQERDGRALFAQALQSLERLTRGWAVRGGADAARESLGELQMPAGSGKNDVLEPLAFVVHAVGAG